MCRPSDAHEEGYAKLSVRDCVVGPDDLSGDLGNVCCAGHSVGECESGLMNVTDSANSDVAVAGGCGSPLPDPYQARGIVAEVNGSSWASAFVSLQGEVSGSHGR